MRSPARDIFRVVFKLSELSIPCPPQPTSTRQLPAAFFLRKKGGLRVRLEFDFPEWHAYPPKRNERGTAIIGVALLDLRGAVNHGRTNISGKD